MMQLSFHELHSLGQLKPSSYGGLQPCRSIGLLPYCHNNVHARGSLCSVSSLFGKFAPLPLLAGNSWPPAKVGGLKP